MNITVLAFMRFINKKNEDLIHDDDDDDDRQNSPIPVKQNQIQQLWDFIRMKKKKSRPSFRQKLWSCSKRIH